RSEFEAGEIEGRRDGTPDQGPVAKRACGLPDPARDDDLRRLAQTEVAAEAQVPGRASIVAHREFERRAVVVVPDLVGIDAMPVRALAGLEQEEDRRARAATFVSGGRPEGLAIV